MWSIDSQLLRGIAIGAYPNDNIDQLMVAGVDHIDGIDLLRHGAIAANRPVQCSRWITVLLRAAVNRRGCCSARLYVVAKQPAEKAFRPATILRPVTVRGRVMRARNRRQREFAVLKSGACGSAMPSHRLLCSHPQIADRPRGDGPMRKMVVPVAVALVLFSGGCSGNAPNTSPTGSSPGIGPSRRLPPPAAASSTPPGGPAPAPSGAAPPASVTRSAPATVAASPTPSGATTTTSAPTARAAPTTQAAPTTNPPPRAATDFSGTCEGMVVCPPANGAAGAANNPGPVANTDFSGTCEGMAVCPPANAGAGANGGAGANQGAGAANNPGPVANTDFSGTCEGEEFCPPAR
jgi:hypothetical protein